MNEKEIIIISLGGAIVVPELPNPEFISKFRDLIIRWTKKNKRFVIIVGGGKVCRQYNDALSKIIDATDETLDWMGIYATRFNAQLIRLSFDGYASDTILVDPAMVRNLNDDIIIGAGWKPGCSTDMDTVLIAKELKAKKVINLSSIDYVYDYDPNININAEKFENLSWEKYLSFIGTEWKPGLNLPFDPIASREAAQENMEVAFMSGNNLESLENYLEGLPFTGTTIK